MTYGQVLDYLYSKLPMYQRVGKAAYKKDLSNTLRLLTALGQPQAKFKSVHIAGTNGKGTSAHGIAAILQTAGYNVGLYTSPHLKHFTERIRINGAEVGEDFVVDFVKRTKPLIEEIEPSFFEITVAMAFDYFAKQQVDIAIVETGLGGRLDSTNVIKPEVSLITNIGYDHMDMLGDTLDKIAWEKAGIIKPDTPVVIGELTPETEPVFRQKAREMPAEIILPEPYEIRLDPLVPEYFHKNIPGIVATTKVLSAKGFDILPEHIEAGLRNINNATGLKGRFQILSRKPLMVADVSHNEDGLKSLFTQVEKLCKGTLHLIFGTVKDKDLSRILSLLPTENTRFYLTQSHVPRALPVADLFQKTTEIGLRGEIFQDVNLAIKDAMSHAGAEDVILITGSTFLVAEIENL